MTLAIALAAALLGASCAHRPPAEPPGRVEFRQQPGGYLAAEAGRPILFYQLEPKSLDGRYERSNYVHPLYGLDGERLTEDFPRDHPHHRGVFWAWHQVRVGDVRAGDQWLASRFSWRLQGAEVLPGGSGLRVVHRWHSPDYLDGARPIVEEVAAVRIRPAEGGLRLVDFDVRLAALQAGVRLGGSEDAKGYGGFSVRVRMVEDLRFTTRNGPVQPEVLALRLGDWVDFSGTFGAPGGSSGIAILVHPSSAGHPQDWILRAPASPSMQNPVWPGAEPAALPEGGEVRLRYRLVVHRGTLPATDLDALAKAFAALP